MVEVLADAARYVAIVLLVLLLLGPREARADHHRIMAQRPSA